jgi:hypothetical protein
MDSGGTFNELSSGAPLDFTMNMYLSSFFRSKPYVCLSFVVCAEIVMIKYVFNGQV